MKSLVIISAIVLLAILNEGEGGQYDVPLITTSTVDKCPKVGLISAVYEVVDILKTTPEVPKIGGCAFLDSNNTDFISNYLMLWVGSLENGEPRCRKPGMTRIEFSCNKELQPPHNDVGTMYEQLLATISDYDGHYYVTVDPKTLDRRCAIHDMVKGSNDTTFRMAISQDMSCESLTDIMKTNQPNESNKGAMLLQFNRTKLILTVASMLDWYEINETLQSKYHYVEPYDEFKYIPHTELRRLHRSP